MLQISNNKAIFNLTNEPHHNVFSEMTLLQIDENVKGFFSVNFKDLLFSMSLKKVLNKPISFCGSSKRGKT